MRVRAGSDPGRGQTPPEVVYLIHVDPDTTAARRSPLQPSRQCWFRLRPYSRSNAALAEIRPHPRSICTFCSRALHAARLVTESAACTDSQTGCEYFPLEYDTLCLKKSLLPNIPVNNTESHPIPLSTFQKRYMRRDFHNI